MHTLYLFPYLPIADTVYVTVSLLPYLCINAVVDRVVDVCCRLLATPAGQWPGEGRVSAGAHGAAPGKDGVGTHALPHGWRAWLAGLVCCKMQMVMGGGAGWCAQHRQAARLLVHKTEATHRKCILYLVFRSLTSHPYDAGTEHAEFSPARCCHRPCVVTPTGLGHGVSGTPANQLLHIQQALLSGLFLGRRLGGQR